MNCIEQELQKMLEIGVYFSSGPRYLLYYYGQPAITNDAGLMRWPEGPKVIVSVIKAQECMSGLSPARKSYLLAKLHSIEGVRKSQNLCANEEKGRLGL
jgi:hypothetical protein